MCVLQTLHYLDEMHVNCVQVVRRLLGAPGQTTFRWRCRGGRSLRDELACIPLLARRWGESLRDKVACSPLLARRGSHCL